MVQPLLLKSASGMEPYNDDWSDILGRKVE